ncbi:alpha/beta hydrolase [Aquimarina brevivitae]|uniref:Alpha-beta hydrolase superfamily lysophospholipase n=1 Tax=Aquimarina brevivitae TaxID=323412 RepID=A0A4Q7P211_9FLAO|nr:alpha/beta hydrolase [Aquimarina brevivitae]RZS93420.1 alpha-beta hydrolase superfamily lysophospholipase [Aquimarina brevivitae]
MEHREFSMTHTGYKLYGEYWLPKGCKAMLLLVHGMGEHLGRYKEFLIPEFLAKHIGVVAFDNFGHGKSGGKRGYCPGYAALMEVIEAALKKTQTLANDLPVFFYGHSMGGNLVLNYILRNQPIIKGAVVSSPLLQLSFQPARWKLVMGKIIKQVLPSLTLSSGLDARAISRLPEEVEKYETDPMVHDKVSPSLLLPVLEAGQWALAHANQLQVPVLLVHGTGDQITDYESTLKFAKEATNAEVMLFDKGYHELHNDMERERLLISVVEWIEKLIRD